MFASSSVHNYGPESNDMASVWLAAHWPGKLKKDAVLKFVIQQYIDKILDPAFPAPLRVRSHLLAGIVHIYSRKVRYLYEEASRIRAQTILSMRKPTQLGPEASLGEDQGAEGNVPQGPEDISVSGSGPSEIPPGSGPGALSTLPQTLSRAGGVDRNLLDKAHLQQHQLHMPDLDTNQMLHRLTDSLGLSDVGVMGGRTDSDDSVGSYLSSMIDRRLDSMGGFTTEAGVGGSLGLGTSDDFMNELMIARSMLEGNTSVGLGLGLGSDNLDDLLAQDSMYLRQFQLPLNASEVLSGANFANFSNFASITQQTQLPRYAHLGESGSDVSGDFSLSVQVPRSIMDSQGLPLSQLSQPSQPSQTSSPFHISAGHISGTDMSLSVEQARALASVTGPTSLGSGFDANMKGFLEMSSVPSFSTNSIQPGSALFGAPPGVLLGTEDIDFSEFRQGEDDLFYDDEVLKMLQHDARNAPSKPTSNVPSGEQSPLGMGISPTLQPTAVPEMTSAALRREQFVDFQTGEIEDLTGLLAPNLLDQEASDAGRAAAAAIVRAPAARSVAPDSTLILPADSVTELSLEYTAMRQTTVGHQDCFPAAGKRRTVLSDFPSGFVYDVDSSGTAKMGTFIVSSFSSHTSFPGEMPLPFLNSGRLDILTLIRRPRLAQVPVGTGPSDQSAISSQTLPSSYTSYAGADHSRTALIVPAATGGSFATYVGDQPEDYSIPSGPHPRLREACTTLVSSRLRDRISQGTSRQGSRPGSRPTHDLAGVGFDTVQGTSANTHLEGVGGSALMVEGGEPSLREEFSLENLTPADLVQFGLEEFEPYLSEVTAVHEAQLASTRRREEEALLRGTTGVDLSDFNALALEDSTEYRATRERELGTETGDVYDEDAYLASASGDESAAGLETRTSPLNALGVSLQRAKEIEGETEQKAVSSLEIPDWVRTLPNHPPSQGVPFSTAIADFVTSLEGASRMAYEQEVKLRVQKISAARGVSESWLKEYERLLMEKYSRDLTQTRSASLAFSTLLHLASTGHVMVRQEAPYEEIYVANKVNAGKRTAMEMDSHSESGSDVEFGVKRPRRSFRSRA